MAVLIPADVRAAGLTRQTHRTARARGELTGLWRGVDVHDPVGDRLAALGALCPLALLSGPSAARALGLDVPAEWTDELTVPDGRSRIRARADVRVVSRPLPPEDRVGQAELRCTSLARTVADVLCRPELEDAVWVLDQALRRGTSAAEVGRRLYPGQRGVRLARTRLACGDGRSESALETRVRLMLAAAGLPPPELQYVVVDGEGRVIARLDFAWPEVRVALEADGVRWHADPVPLLVDRRRQNALAVRGWTVLRATSADVHCAPRTLVGTVGAALGG